MIIIDMDEKPKQKLKEIMQKQKESRISRKI